MSPKKDSIGTNRVEIHRKNCQNDRNSNRNSGSTSSRKAYSMSRLIVEIQRTSFSDRYHSKKQLLDFKGYPEWQKSGLVRLLEPEDSSRTLPTLQPGDKIKCDIDGMKFTAEIKVGLQTPRLHRWYFGANFRMAGKFRTSLPMARPACHGPHCWVAQL